MCNCNNKPEFKKLLIQAQDFTKRLAGTWVVFKIPNTDKIAVGKESVVKKIEGVCCYTLPNGIEVENIQTKEVVIEDVVRTKGRVKQSK